MTLRRIAKDGYEMDAFSRWWRRQLCYMQRAGVAKSAKRSASRRERREAKDNLRNGRDDRL